MKFSFFFFLFIFLIALTSAAVNIGEENTLSRGVNIVAPSVVIIDTNATTGCSGSQVLFGNGSCGLVNGSGGIGDFLFTDFQASYDLNLTNIFNQDLNTTNNVNFGNLTILNNLSVDGNTFFVDNVNNRVGIGTTTPVAPLEIQSLAASMRQTRYSDTDVQSAGLTVQRSGGTTVGTDVIVQDGWRIANFNLRGYDGATYRTAASIQAFIDGTPGAGDMPGRLTFLTTSDGASSATERMRLDSVGNLGIGVTPTYLLEVDGNASINSSFFVTSLGRVGIGTTSPTHSLNVIGSGNFTGDLFVQSINVTQFFYNQTIMRNIFNQDLNTTNSPTFEDLSLGNDLIIKDSNAEIRWNGVNGSRINYFKGGNNANFMSIDPLSQDPTTGVTVRFFRQTNTTGLRRILLLQGDNSVTEVHSISVSGITVFNQQGSESLDFRIEGDTEQNLFFVDAGTDRIGIGTSSPDQELHILNSASSTTELHIENLNTGTAATASVELESDAQNLFLIAHGTGRTLTRSGITLGDWAEILGLSSSGILIDSTADIPIVFGNNNLERMRIDAGGFVGIGTISPTHELNVIGKVNFSRTGQLDLILQNPTRPWFITSDNSPDIFSIGVDGNRQLFTLDSGGNVGIGTSSPAQELTVAGSINISADFTSDDTGDLGWSTQFSVNQACTTTCISACVMGFADRGSGHDPTTCSDATADACLCAGAS